MEKTLAPSYPNSLRISHHRLLPPAVVKVSAWRTTQSRMLTLQSSQQRRCLTLSSNSTHRIVCLFGGGNKGKGKDGGDLTGKDAAIKALEQAFGGKRNPFSKWVETQKIEADMGGKDNGGNDGGDGWSGGRDGSDGYNDEGKPGDDRQTILANLAFFSMYFWMCFWKEVGEGVVFARRFFRDYLNIWRFITDESVREAYEERWELLLEDPHSVLGLYEFEDSDSDEDSDYDEDYERENRKTYKQYSHHAKKRKNRKAYLKDSDNSKDSKDDKKHKNRKAYLDSKHKKKDSGFVTLPEYFAAFKKFWKWIFSDKEQQVKDSKEFELLLKDLLEYKRHGHNSF